MCRLLLNAAYIGIEPGGLRLQRTAGAIRRAPYDVPIAQSMMVLHSDKKTPDQPNGWQFIVLLSLTA